MYPGGQALNFAAYARTLGIHSEYLGVFGTDAVAAHVKQTLDKLGIPYPRCRTYPGENGYAKVTIENGDRVFCGSNKGGVLQGHYLQLSQADLDYIAKFSVVHTTNNAFFDVQLPKLRPLDVFVSYDFSIRWTEADRIGRVAPYIDAAFLSCGDLPETDIRVVCSDLYARGVKLICATRGSKGSLTYDGARFYAQPPVYVDAIDTMGAGDSFATALLVELGQALTKDGKTAWYDPQWREQTLEKALRHAAAFAAKTCLTDGAFGYGVPVPAELSDRLLQSQKT